MSNGTLSSNELDFNQCTENIELRGPCCYGLFQHLINQSLVWKAIELGFYGFFVANHTYKPTPI